MATDQPIPDPSEEQWRPIPGYEGSYSISSWGRVRSEARRCYCGRGATRAVKECILVQTRIPNGYLTVLLDFKSNRSYVHQLMAFTFIGPRPSNMHVRHLDDNKLNNRADNIAYGTRRENTADSKRNGTYAYPPVLIGSDNHKAKLTTADVEAIKASTETGIVLGKRYGVGRAAIWKIRNGRTWKSPD